MSFLDNAIGSVGSNVKNAFQGITSAIGGALTLDLAKVAQGLQQAMGGGTESSSTEDSASSAASSMADDGLRELLKMMQDKQSGGGGLMAQLGGSSGMRA